jgi:hypothetical protein
LHSGQVKSSQSKSDSLDDRTRGTARIGRSGRHRGEGKGPAPWNRDRAKSPDGGHGLPRQTFADGGSAKYFQFYFLRDSLCGTCFRSRRQYFFSSRRSAPRVSF